MKHTSLAATVAAAATALLIAACGSSSSTASSTSSPASSSASSSSSAAASSTASGSTTGSFTGCMVTDTGGIDDRSFNASSWQGMQEAAAADPSVTVKYLQSTTQSDYVPNINTFISEKCGIIVTVGFLMAAATETAAKAHPSQKFAIVDCSYASA
jgi:basic membrane protein A